MKAIQKLISSGLALIMLLALVKGAGATSNLIRDYSGNREALMVLRREQRIAGELYGDIIKIGPDQMTLRTQETSQVLKISGFAGIYCNGNLSYWEALIPVCPGAYFEARVYLDAAGEVLFIDGFYYGEEGIIQSYQWINHRLQLGLYHPQNGRWSLIYVSDRAVLPEEKEWLRVDQAVYVLYNINGEIRKVVLPD